MRVYDMSCVTKYMLTLVFFLHGGGDDEHQAMMMMMTKLDDVDVKISI